MLVVSVVGVGVGVVVGVLVVGVDCVMVDWFILVMVLVNSIRLVVYVNFFMMVFFF